MPVVLPAADLTALQTAFSTAISGIQSDFNGNVVIALPIALGIMGTFVAVRLAVRFFKSVAK